MTTHDGFRDDQNPPDPREPDGMSDEDLKCWKALGAASPVAPATEIPRAEALIKEWDPPRGVSGKAIARRHMWRIPGAAAAAIILFASGWIAGGNPQNMPDEPVESGFAELATGSDLVTARLSDGTLVRVGAGSLIRFTETSNRRDVWLDGQAFFAVASDPDRPFRVRSAGGEAEAIGTRFDYRSTGDELQLIVVDGRVALSSGGQRVEVGAGEMRGIRAAQISSATKVEDVYGALSWMGRSLVFHGTPLDAVARELSARFDIPVRLSESALSERTVTASFKDQDFEEVFTAICRAVNAECSHSADGAVMAPRVIGAGSGR